MTPVPLNIQYMRLTKAESLLCFIVNTRSAFVLNMYSAFILTMHSDNVVEFALWLCFKYAYVA